MTILPEITREKNVSEIIHLSNIEHINFQNFIKHTKELSD